MIDEHIHILKTAPIDGTHIRVSLSSHEKTRYTRKTGIDTQNVLAVCDFDLRFTCVSTGQPRAMHDTSVLYNAISVDKRNLPTSSTRQYE